MSACLASCALSPLFKGVYSKRKEFVPRESKFFPSRTEHFSEALSSIAQSIAGLISDPGVASSNLRSATLLSWRLLTE